MLSLGAIEPQQCPLGYKEYSGSLRRTFAETCEPCQPGYYGAHPNRSETETEMAFLTFEGLCNS